jgi:SpoIID/LytB domain protein
VRPIGLLLLLLLVSGCFSPLFTHATPINQDVIRVGLSYSGLTQYVHPVATVSAQSGLLRLSGQLPGDPVIWQGEGSIQIRRLSNRWQLTLPNQQVLWSDVPQLHASADRVRVSSLKRPGGVPFYRGVIDFIPANAQGFYLVNTLDMQDYLKAVVPNELPIRFGMEAVKAQSVAARNYALRPRETFWKAFDICDSQYCQAYYGAQTETEPTSRAVDETAGLVLLYQHQYALTVFSSTAGGLTEAYAHVFSDPVTRQFPAPALPYLVARADELTAASMTPPWDLSSEAAARAFWTRHDVPSYDSASPYYRWTRQWTAAQLQQDVKSGLLKVSRDGATRAFVQPLLTHPTQFGQLKDLRVLQRGQTGKAMRLQIVTSSGSWVVSKEFLIRSVLNRAGKLLPSGNVVLTPQRFNGSLIGLMAQGGGLGHGVGMSQFGASGMARQGKTFDQILAQYYPGTVLATRPLLGQGASQTVSVSFHKPPHGPLMLGLWVQGAINSLTLNQQPLKLEGQQYGLQCYPLPAAQLLDTDNSLTLTASPTAKAWVTFAPCHH